MAKSSNKVAGAIIVAAILVVGGFWFMQNGVRAPTLAQLGQPGQSPQQNQQAIDQALGICNNGQVTSTTATFNIRNGENDQATEKFNVTAYLVGSKGHQTSVTNTDGGTATLNCGETYSFMPISASGDGGDNVRISAIESLDTTARLVGENRVDFTPTSSAYTLSVVGSRHGVPEFRIYNEDNAAWRYSDSAANNNGWQLTGKQWNGTTSENSTVAVGSGGSFTDDVHFRSNATFTDVSDLGYYILVDASTAKWNEPTLRLDGAVLTKTNLNSDEARQWGSTYEYAYKVNGRITDSEHVLKTEFKALSGVNPVDVDSPTVAIAAVGAYLQTASVSNVKIGAAKDDSSATAVHTIQTAELLVS